MTDVVENGRADIREVQSLVIGSEERLMQRLDQTYLRLDDRLRRVERWAYAVPLTFLIVLASVVGAAIGRGTS